MDCVCSQVSAATRNVPSCTSIQSLRSKTVPGTTEVSANTVRSMWVVLWSAFVSVISSFALLSSQVLTADTDTREEWSVWIIWLVSVQKANPVNLCSKSSFLLLFFVWISSVCEHHVVMNVPLQPAFWVAYGNVRTASSTTANPKPGKGRKIHSRCNNLKCFYFWASVTALCSLSASDCSFQRTLVSFPHPADQLQSGPAAAEQQQHFSSKQHECQQRTPTSRPGHLLQGESSEALLVFCRCSE